MIRLLALTAVVAAVACAAAAAHPGGKFWTVSEMEGNLQRGGVYEAICEGRGTAKRKNLPLLFWQYKHFRCVLNSLARGRVTSICVTAHTVRSGKFVLTNRAPAGRVRCL